MYENEEILGERRGARPWRPPPALRSATDHYLVQQLFFFRLFNSWALVCMLHFVQMSDNCCELLVSVRKDMCPRYNGCTRLVFAEAILPSSY